MAYSRFIESDIYIYPHVGGHIECAACILNQEDNPHHVFPRSEMIWDDEHLVAHIAEHRAREHHVPDNLEAEILADPERYGRLR